MIRRFHRLTQILYCVWIFAGAAALASPDPIRPDMNLTPGVTNPAVTDVCAIKWGKDVRHVTASMKHQVFAAYGIPWARHAEFEVDHLVSRELGGADDVKNLWPQPLKGQWNAHMKDRLENALHKEVCAGTLALSQAQLEIRADWISAYSRHVINAK